MSEHIRTARFVELAGIDHFPWFGNQDTIIRKVEKFLETVRADEASFDRVLATVMFTDIVESTDTVASLGDRSWAALLDQHRRVFRSVLARYKGREVKTTGDGFLAIFDGPARAVRCAQEAVSAVRAIGLDIRVGCHIGEIELEDDDVQGITVHIAARISALANGGEVLVSRTMTELVAGSGFIFEDRGTYELKGVPGKWHLFLAGNPE
jgi:class 3 adenylate cyclase